MVIRLRFVFALLAASILCFIVFNTIYRPSTNSTAETTFEDEKTTAMPENQACVFPKIKPESSNVRKEIQPVNCKHLKHKDIVKIDGPNIETNVSNCQYRQVFMKGDFYTNVSSTTFPLPKGKSPCPAEVFYVECGKVFRSLFRCITQKQLKKPTVSTEIFSEPLNILIFGLDSMSRVAWLEQMVKTTTFAESTLGAITFRGYNIVGDGTTAAILGFTSGFYEEELHEAKRGFEGASTIDDWPFIWRQLSDAGYQTLWDEDSPFFGTFQYRLVGFEQPPVDHYGREFQLELFRQYPGDCLNTSMPTFLEMVQQFRQMFSTYPDPVKKFAFVFNSMYTHTALKTEQFQTGYRVDDMLAEELRWLSENGYLNQSVVLLMADHGSRYGKERVTFRGKVAERLPYLAIVFPEWFQDRYRNEMQNLRTAAEHRLTTPFDLHATLLDLVGIKPIPGTPQRGRSFFRPIPAERTCEDAGILPHWCACVDEGNTQTLNSSDPLVSAGLAAFMDYVNGGLLKSLIDDGVCLPIRAERPFMARKLGLRREIDDFLAKLDQSSAADDANLEMSFRTQPGDGQWEVTLSVQGATGKITVSKDQISRTNLYGSAPECIQDKFPHLRPFCYCADNTPKTVTN